MSGNKVEGEIEDAREQYNAARRKLALLDRNASSRRHSSSLVPALATVLVHILLYGTRPQADEDTAAHIWQLLMAAPVFWLGW